MLIILYYRYCSTHTLPVSQTADKEDRQPGRTMGARAAEAAAAAAIAAAARRLRRLQAERLVAAGRTAVAAAPTPLSPSLPPSSSPSPPAPPRSRAGSGGAAAAAPVAPETALEVIGVLNVLQQLLEVLHGGGGGGGDGGGGGGGSSSSSGGSGLQAGLELFAAELEAYARGSKEAREALLDWGGWKRAGGGGRGGGGRWCSERLGLACGRPVPCHAPMQWGGGGCVNFALQAQQASQVLGTIPCSRRDASARARAACCLPTGPHLGPHTAANPLPLHASCPNKRHSTMLLPVES